ncbi:hypothetical protein ABIB80_007244 [Bradyrhizobium sp. i1.15.2]
MSAKARFDGVLSGPSAPLRRAPIWDRKPPRTRRRQRMQPEPESEGKIEAHRASGMLVSAHQTIAVTLGPATPPASRGSFRAIGRAPPTASARAGNRSGHRTRLRTWHRDQMGEPAASRNVISTASNVAFSVSINLVMMVAIAAVIPSSTRTRSRVVFGVRRLRGQDLACSQRVGLISWHIDVRTKACASNDSDEQPTAAAGRVRCGVRWRAGLARALVHFASNSRSQDAQRFCYTRPEVSIRSDLSELALTN